MNAQTKMIPGQVPTWSFGDRIRKARRIMGYTQADMSTALGVGEKAYAAWESERTSPESIIEIAAKLETVTGIDKLWFVGWMDDDHTPNAKKAPTPKGGGRELPDLDSNQEPAGNTPIALPSRSTDTPEHDYLAPITRIA